jgi:hypothetical protein
VTSYQDMTWNGWEPVVWDSGTTRGLDASRADPLRLPLADALLGTDPDAHPGAGVYRRILPIGDDGTGLPLHTYRMLVAPRAAIRAEEMPLPPLPLAVVPSVAGVTQPLRIRDHDETLHAIGQPQPYIVEALRVMPSPGLAAGRESLRIGGGRYRGAPQPVNARIYRFATRDLAIGALGVQLNDGELVATPLDKLNVVRNLFERGIPGGPAWEYSLTLPRPRGGMSLLETFLLTDRRGHCELFATAAVLLLRTMQVSSRVVVGYRGLEPVGDTAREDDFIVRSANAHMWVEVYLDGLGWYAFDPTPAASRDALVRGLAADGTTGDDESAIEELLGGESGEDALAGGLLDGDADPESADAMTDADDDADVGEEPDGLAGIEPAGRDDEPLAQRDAIATFTADSQAQLSKALQRNIAGIAAVVVPVLVLLVVVGLVAAGRRSARAHARPASRRERRPGPDAGRVFGEPVPEHLGDAAVAMQQVLDALARAGHRRSDAQTIRRFALRVAPRLGAEAGRALLDLTAMYYALRFGGADLSEVQRARALATAVLGR